MNASNIDHVPRIFLPRWIPTNVGTISKDTRTSLAAELQDTFESHFSDWKKEQSLSSAEALVAYAISTERPFDSSIACAAKFVIENAPTSLSAKHSKELLEGASPLADTTIYHKIASTRRIARKYPFSALVWSDLAYYHCLTGNRKSARAAAIASDHVSSGAPSEVLPFSRCMVHLDEPEHALRSTRASLKLNPTPAVISTEMAICQILDTSTKHYHNAIKLIASKNITPQEDAKLRASIATEFVNSGSDRKAKKIISGIQINPDENTLAQLVWLSGVLGLELNPASAGLKEANEAIARAAYQERDYALCLKATEGWCAFQPFSVTAISFGSYVAGFLTDDHERSLKLLQQGQIVGAESFTIWNNSAFDYSKLDRLKEAERALQMASRCAITDEDRDVLNATTGLYLIRKGSAASGEALYRQSIKNFMSRKDLRSASIASLMCAEELSRVGNSDAATLLQEANKLAEEGKHPRILEAVQMIRKKISKGFD